MPHHTHILPIPPDRWPPPDAPVVIDGITLAPKPELPLIGTALRHELQATFAASFLDAALAAARAAQDWHYARTGETLLLRRSYPDGDRRQPAHALVELIDLPAMARFHHALGRLLGRQLPVPPPHVTLYTAGRERGIGVSSPVRLRAFTQRRLHDSPQ